VERDALAEAFGRLPPDRAEVLAALARVPVLRADLDALERAGIDAARRSGASWNEIASALRLRSRQAAEQRRLRLGSGDERRDAGEIRRRRQRQRIVDNRAGQEIIELRVAVEDLAAGIDAAGSRPAVPAVRLARETVRVALVAEPGALFHLARTVVTDLVGLPEPDLGGPRVTDALRRLRAIVGRR
jgi:hypothetical protein